MFARPKDRSVEVWDGPRCGPEGCKALFGADEAHPIGTLQSFLDDLVKKTSKATSDGSVHIYTDLPVRVVDPSDPKSPGPRPPSFHTSYSVTDPSREDREACLSSFVRNLTVPEPILESGMSANETDEKSSGWWSFKGTAAAAKQAQRIFMRPLKSHLQELRLVKSDSEASMLLTAGNITGAGFREMFRSCRPGSTEHALYATFDGHTRQLGATRMAYVPVVASGRNALTLHYVHNRALLCEGDLVLVDAGIEYEGYVSDVTRTFPVSGRFTDPQRNLYQALLRVQKTCVAKCTESTGLSLDEIHSFSHSELRKELESLFGRYVTPREMDRLYPHHVGHWMGMDVHDSDGISRTRKLKKGMVVTIGGFPGFWRAFFATAADPTVFLRTRGLRPRRRHLSFRIPRSRDEDRR